MTRLPRWPALVLALFVLAAFLPTREARADDPYFASVRGTVRDSQGRPLPGTSLTVSGDGVGRSRQRTGRDGTYRFPALRPLARYSITAELAGYRTVTYDGLVLQPGRARGMDFRLKRPGEREVVALVTRDPFPYQDLLRGFTQGLDVPVRVVDLDQEADPAESVRRVRAEHPSLLLGAGLRAARLIRREIPDAPAILTLVTDPRRYDLETSTTCFLANAPDPDEVVRRLTTMLPRARRIGLVYDADLSVSVAHDLLAAAGRAGIQVDLRPRYKGSSPEETLDPLRGRIDALLLPFDPLSASPDTVERVTRWALRNHVPLAAPGPDWVRRGALYAYGASTEQIGAEASRLAAEILYHGHQPSDFGVRVPPSRLLAVNRGTAEALGITLPPDLDAQVAY